MAQQDRSSSDRAEQSASRTHYTVLARRWRPQQFDDLIGQEAIGQALQGAIASNRVAHAYLFTGARGVGKTSTARILAKALNCSDGPTCTPCGTCDACESIASGDDVDVLEIDGASNRGIDEVRELRQNVNLRPTRCRYKIYIIDEVHMLTREAFNALLKTLEEPPPHVKFIFATTDAQKIPITILSRCQRFDFGTISSERIQQRLQEIVKSEGIAVEEEVLELLSRRAAGSMRDSLSLLDQLLAFGGEQVTAEQLHRLLGTASEDRVMEMTTSLLGRNPGAAIQALDRAESEGVQLGELLDQLTGYFRDLMLIKVAGANARLGTVSSRQRNRVTEQAGAVSLDSLLAAADMLAETKNRLRGSTYGRVLLDVALVRIASLEDLAPLSDLADQLSALESRLSGAVTSPRAAASGPARSAPTADLKKNYPPSEPARPDVSDARDLVAARETSTEAVGWVESARLTGVPRTSVPSVGLADSAHHTSTPNQTTSGWTTGVAEPATTGVPPLKVPRPLTPQAASQLIRDLAQGFGPVLKESLLRAVLSVDPASDTLEVSLDPMYNGAAKVNEIEAVLQQRVGPSPRVRVQLIDHTTAALKEPPARRSSYSERLSEASRDSLVQHAIELFGARVMRVDEP